MLIILNIFFVFFILIIIFIFIVVIIFFITTEQVTGSREMGDAHRTQDRDPTGPAGYKV